MQPPRNYADPAQTVYILAGLLADRSFKGHFLRRHLVSAPRPPVSPAGGGTAKIPFKFLIHAVRTSGLQEDRSWLFPDDASPVVGRCLSGD
jgi:hypothetical protein